MRLSFFGSKPSVGLWGLLLVCGLAGFSPASYAAADLSLAEASNRMLQQHPQLAQFVGRFQLLAAEQELAQQSTPLSISLETSELAGTGGYSGVKSAETTLSLISVFESGSKRQARQTLVGAERNLAEAEQQAQVLLLMGTLTQQYVTTLAWQERCALMSSALDLNKAALIAVRERVSKAAAPEAELLRAQVAQVQTEVALANCQVSFDISLQELATAMGQKSADFRELNGDLLAISANLPMDQLDVLIANSTLVKVHAQQQSLQQAQYSNLQAATKTDIQWSLGATHFAATDDVALALGVEIPLFNERRNSPQLAKARAQVDLMSAEQQQSMQQLYADLYTNALQLKAQTAAAQRLKQEALPLLQQAYQQANRAYQQGRYSYSEWMSLARELIETREQLITTSAAARISQARIEAIIGSNLNKEL